MHALCFLLFSSIFISTIPLLFFVLQTCVLRLLACISFKEMINLGVWTKRVFSFGMVSAFTACTQELVLVFSCWGIKIVTARDGGFAPLLCALRSKSPIVYAQEFGGNSASSTLAGIWNCLFFPASASHCYLW